MYREREGRWMYRERGGGGCTEGGDSEDSRLKLS